MKTKIITITIILFGLMIVEGSAFAQFKTMTDIGHTQSNPDLFKLSPNPVKDNLKLTLKEEKHEHIKITILNVIGQVVFHKDYVDYPDDINLDLSDFDKGLYVLNVRVNNWYSTDKFLIE